MGKATILSGGDAGLYRIRLDYGTAARDAELATIGDTIKQLETQIEGLQTSLDAFIEHVETPAKEATTTAVNDYVAASNATPRDEKAVKAALAAHEQALRELFNVRTRYAKLQLLIQDLQAQLAGSKKRKTYLQQLVLNEDRDAWCADYTTSASGEVATIDVPGESEEIIIAPSAPVPNATHGALVAREMQAGAQVYFNAAILPGWQRWKPTFRIGDVRSINLGENTMSVDLEPETSSAQDLGVNQTTSLSSVPVTYMTCGAGAFSIGDRVVVRFDDQDWKKPRVVGFADHPRPCNVAYVGCEYWEFTADLIINIHVLVALIDVETKQVIEVWRRRFTLLAGIVSYNSQPYVQQGGGFPQSWSWLVDMSAPPDDASLPTRLQSVQQQSDKLYGIVTGNGSDPADYKTIVELQDGEAITEIGRWTVGNASSSFNSLSVSGGHVAVGGFVDVSTAYGVRIFNTVTRALIAERAVNGPVESVDMTLRFLVVLHWGSMVNFGYSISIFSRASGYSLLSSHDLDVMPYSVCLIRDRIVAKSEGVVWIWMLDPITGAITPDGTMTPFAVAVEEIGGQPGSGIVTDGSGGPGHHVVSVARA